jgi:pyruvate dehydrogenase E2 component (dihydrolipoamide acetyltransferase)
VANVFEFRLPDVGEGIHEVEILEWRVKPGDRVRAFDPLCQVESAKAAVELTAPVDGRIAETRVPAGQTARVGEVLVLIETAAASEPTHPPVAEPPAEEWFGIVGSAPVGPHRLPPPPQGEGVPSTANRLPLSPWGRGQAVGADRPASNPIRAAPYVRKLAKDRGIRLEEVTGSGPEGRVRVADLEAYLAQQLAKAAPAAGKPAVVTAAADEERVPLRGLRKRVAEHMAEAARLAPQVTSMDLFDVTELVLAREQLRLAAEKEGVKLTYLTFVVKAAIEALRAVPYANARFDDATQTLVVKRSYNVGIATAVPGGLVVPVVKGADRLSLVELAGEIGRLVEAARARQSSPADLEGGSFTITSFGGLPGSPLFATPILNYPEVAILGIGRIEEQPRVVGGQIVARHCMGVSFTFDHRVLDGEGAGQFMAVLRRYLERPLELLLHLH